MSYTLRGRIESRLAAAVPALAVALALHRWWAIELVALMLAIGLVLDVGVYHRALPYQAGWLALPLGAAELALVYGAMRALPIHAPLGEALGLYAVAWASAQLLGHALLPRLRLSYAEAGGELGRGGPITAAAVAIVLVAGLGADYAVRPPTIHLHGVVQGPLVVRHAETLTGGTVRGGIVVRADHVTIRNVTVLGGRNGIDVEHAAHVTLDRVRVLRVQVDGIHVRDSGVMIDRCSVTDPAGPWVQGIDVSYSIGRPMSMISDCTIAGVREGIVTHSAAVNVMDNHVVGTRLRGIVLGEMSMDMASGNRVEAAQGVGILCLDHSTCEISHNTIAGTHVAPGDDLARQGVAIEAQSYASATLRQNTILASPGGVRAFSNATIER
ncbi:MAG TPA: right-handed parallel beta-helix repeat-containing protein [Gaiellaceae bacterium]